jgi:hypothetical protein
MTYKDNNVLKTYDWITETASSSTTSVNKAIKTGINVNMGIFTSGELTRVINI